MHNNNKNYEEIVMICGKTYTIKINKILVVCDLKQLKKIKNDFNNFLNEKKLVSCTFKLYTVQSI